MQNVIQIQKPAPQSPLERALAVVILALLSPVLLLVAIVIRISSGGPILFLQERVGYNGRVFKIYKFRTMVPNAEIQTGPTLSWKGDPRVTALGHFLRSTHIDEFPQLLNIIRGEMSFIGPRPERPMFTAQFQQQLPAYRVRERALPGVTGLAQVLAPYDALPQEKLVLDLKYISDQSVALRLRILWLTFLALIGMRQQWQVENVEILHDGLENASTDLMRGVVTHGEPVMAD